MRRVPQPRPSSHRLLPSCGRVRLRGLPPSVTCRPYPTQPATRDSGRAAGHNHDELRRLQDESLGHFNTEQLAAFDSIMAAHAALVSGRAGFLLRRRARRYWEDLPLQHRPCRNPLQGENRSCRCLQRCRLHLTTARSHRPLPLHDPHTHHGQLLLLREKAELAGPAAAYGRCHTLGRGAHGPPALS